MHDVLGIHVNMLIYSNDNKINRLFLCDHFQIQKFVLQLKKTPCWEKAQPQESLLRQKCRSTNWIVLASFLTNLFALKGEVRILIKQSRRRRRAIISIAPYLANKDEHAALYKINKNVHIPTSEIIYRRNIVYLEHHTCTHTRTHARAHRHTHTYAHTRMHARTHTHTHLRMHAHTYAHARMHACTHTHVHTHEHTHTRTHAHTRMLTHEHTHTRRCT